MTSVVQALSAVMEDVQAVRKDGHNSAQNFNFRGIDAVVNAVGPALRKHGVVIVPSVEECVYRDIEVGQKRTLMRETTVRVRYTAHGPEGDTISGVTAGEAMDSGDKGTAKAFSVAYRTFLLQALTIPTDEPDADSSSFERTAPEADEAPCPTCQVIVSGARSDKEPMREHMVTVHGWVRNDDGTVGKVARSGDGGASAETPSAQGAENGTASSDVPAGSAPDVPPIDPPVGDGTLSDPNQPAASEDVDRVQARIMLLKDGDFMPFLEGEGFNLDELTVYDLVQITALLEEWEARAAETPAQKARRAAREAVAS